MVSVSWTPKPFCSGNDFYSIKHSNAARIKSPVTNATKKNFSFPLITTTAPPIPNPLTPTAGIGTVTVVTIETVAEKENVIETEKEIGKGKETEITEIVNEETAIENVKKRRRRNTNTTKSRHNRWRNPCNLVVNLDG
ncbi:hypothetical protein MTR_8g432610 [Medicago truncatula]|uniref:Uncharacterized protein n=1 Tax=Medicago truncatula TaxID=3880 RepID=A0A072TP45_MEDTR|nr:hypothetical protein MTR_8g432610 [Medicago truncatula]